MVTKRKRTPKLSDEWLTDVWTVRPIDYAEGELADFDQLVSSAVARCLKQESRADIARDLSHILGERVTVHMLNAYASEERREHNISAVRLLALIGLTSRFDILDALVREVGGKALDRNGASYFRVGKRYVDYLNAARALREDVAKIFSAEP
jgi:hypothetical protein